MDEPGETDVWDVSGGAEDAFEVPDCFGSRRGKEGRVESWLWKRGNRGRGEGSRRGGSLRIGVDLVKKATAVPPVKDAREAPGLVIEGLDIHNLNDEDISWLCSFNLEWTGEVVDLGQVDILHVVRRIVVFDLATSPVDAFDLNRLAIFNGAAEGDCG